MEQQLISKRTLVSKQRSDAKMKIKEQQESIQLVYTITIIHLIGLIVIAISIRHAIILKIQGVLDIFHLQYLKFSGKTI